jgi:peptide/nickel transport system substrate-binding protein
LLEWTVIPDSATATAALIVGEVDYLTNPVVDNLPLLRAGPNIAIDLLDPLGWQFHIRMNALAKPFDNAKARQAPLMLVESQQEAYLAATGMTGEARQGVPAFGGFREGLMAIDRLARNAK